MTGPKKRDTRIYVALTLLGIIVLAPFVYNLDVVFGRRKFEQLCKSESGGRVYQRLQAGAGWTVDEPIDGSYEYQAPFSYGPVGFVRARNKKGEWFDVVKDPQREGEFLFMPADESHAVRYKYVYDRMRFSRHQRQIIDLDSGKLAASFTEFFFRWTTPERTLLNAPTGASCNLSGEDIRNFARALYSGEANPSP
jgi:hypothetical protein